MLTVTTEKVEPEQWAETDLFLQTAYWARLKRRFGWNAVFLKGQLADADNGAVTPTIKPVTINHEAGAPGAADPTEFHVLVLSRTVAPGIRIAYVPGGPPLPRNHENAGSEFLAQLGSQVAESMADTGTPTVVRFDLPWETEYAPESGALRKSRVDVQPPDTVVVDLNQTENALQSEMKSRCRRNIRKAAKHGVLVNQSNSIDDFYALYRETAERDRIAIHSREYYQAVLEEADDTVATELLVAEVDGEKIAAIIVAYTASQAVYLYGASGNRHRESMPAYALQWEAMRRAQGRGCKSYDLFGIPPTDDPNHPMHGLLLFKTGFGGQTIHRTGCWDYPVQPLRYFLYREAEGARLFYYKKLNKKLHKRRHKSR